MKPITKGKLEKPLTIIYGDDKNVITSDASYPEDVSIINGVMIGDGHYGFVLIFIKKGQVKESVYNTLCQIRAVEFNEEQKKLKIHEDNRYIPWVFNDKGELINKAEFNQFKRSDLAYALDEFGLTPEKNPEEFYKSR